MIRAPFLLCPRKVEPIVGQNCVTNPPPQIGFVLAQGSPVVIEIAQLQALLWRWPKMLTHRHPFSTQLVQAQVKLMPKVRAGDKTCSPWLHMEHRQMPSTFLEIIPPIRKVVLLRILVLSVQTIVHAEACLTGVIIPAIKDRSLEDFVELIDVVELMPSVAIIRCTRSSHFRQRLVHVALVRHH